MYLSFMESLLEEKLITKTATKAMMEKVISRFLFDFTEGSTIFRKCKKFELKYQRNHQSELTEKQL